MDRVERYTYHFHVRAAVAETMFTSLVWSASDVAARNMGAGPLEITLFTMAPGVAQIVSIFISDRLARIDRRKLLLWSGFLGRAPIFLVFFYYDLWTFLTLLTIQSFAQVPIIAAWNALLRSNYTDKLRGTLYGRASQIAAVFSGSAALGAGFWLDYDPEAVRWIYPGVGVLGILSCWIFARVRTRPGMVPAGTGPSPSSLFSFKDVLLKDRVFRIYEIGFFCYGVAFMAAITAQPLFAAQELQLSNTQMLGARAIFSLCLVLGTLRMGKLMDRVGPARLASICYALLACYVIVVSHATGGVSYLLSQVIFGVAMSGVHIAWNMGPVTFAPIQEAARYMGVHMALVGVRAMIGHPVGGLMVSITGQARYVYLFSMAFFIIAAWTMARLASDPETQERMRHGRDLPEPKRPPRA